MSEDTIQWYPCVCGAEHDTPTCPFAPLHICRQAGYDPALHRCLGCRPLVRPVAAEPST